MRIALNLLVAIGILFILTAITELVTGSEISILISLVLLVIGMALSTGSQRKNWNIVAFLTLVPGALLLAGELEAYILDYQLWALISSVLFFVVGYFARSKFMMVVSAATLALPLGASPEYSDFLVGSDYVLGLESPTFAALVFAVLAYLFGMLADKTQTMYAPMVRVFSRTCTVLMLALLTHLSMDGGAIGMDAMYAAAGNGQLLPSFENGMLLVPSHIYLVITLIVLLAFMNRALITHNKFLSVTTGTFLTILFYYEWFTYTQETLGDAYASLIAGVLSVGVGVWLMNSCVASKAVGRTKKVETKTVTETVSTPKKTVTTKKKTTTKKSPKKATAKKTTTTRAVKKKSAAKKAAPKKKTTKAASKKSTSTRKKTTKRTTKKK